MASLAPIPAGAHPALWVLCGGPSTEYDVSLASARGVLAALDYQAYCARLACLAPDGSWLVSPHAFHDTPPSNVADEVFALLQHPDAYPLRLTLPQAMALVASDQPRAVLNVMHGRVGEDGTVQGLFSMMGVPMTGSGVAASGLAMDKVRARHILRAAGLSVPRAHTYQSRLAGAARPSARDIDQRCGFPCVVKPAHGGSSMGVAVVRYAHELDAAIDRALAEDSEVLFEEFVGGTELTCGVLERSDRTDALAVTEIRPRDGDYFDYRAKYVPGAAEEITPARLSADETAIVQTAAVMAHRALGCRGYSRTDFILGHDGRLVVLEVNTLPGMTKTSLLPQGAAAKGISFTHLLTCMVEGAIRHGADSCLPRVPRAPRARPTTGAGAGATQSTSTRAQR